MTDGKFLRLSPELYNYVVAHGGNNDPLLAELAAETAKLGRISGMRVAAGAATVPGAPG